MLTASIPRRSWDLPIDRRRLLDQTDKARRLMENQDLPDHIRNLAKRAADHGEMALMLLDSIRHELLNPPGASPLPPPAPPGPTSRLPEAISSDGLGKMIATLRIARGRAEVNGEKHELQGIGGACYTANKAQEKT